MPSRRLQYNTRCDFDPMSSSFHQTCTRLFILPALIIVAAVVQFTHRPTHALHHGRVHLTYETLPEDPYILVLSPPLDDHARPLLLLSEALLHRGHHVVFAMGRDVSHIQLRIALAQVDVFDLGDADFNRYVIDATAHANRVNDPNPYFFINFATSIMGVYSKGLWEHLVPVLEKRPPALILYDYYVAMAGHMAGKYKIPAVCLHPYGDSSLLQEYSNIPYHIPMTTQYGFQDDDRQSSPSFTDRLTNVVARVMFSEYVRRVAVKNIPCAHFNIPAEICYGLDTIAATYGQLVLVNSYYPVLTRRDRPGFIKVVGPFFNASETPLTESTSPDVVRFMKEIKDEEQCLVYISAGPHNIFDPSQLISVLKAVKRIRSEMKEAGGRKDADETWGCGEIKVMIAKGAVYQDKNAQIFDFVEPGVKFLSPSSGNMPEEWWIFKQRKMAVFVSHCSAESIHLASYYGVPVLGIPLSQEQPMIAAAVNSSGLGIDFQQHFDEEMAYDAIRRLLTIKVQSEDKGSEKQDTELTRVFEKDNNDDDDDNNNKDEDGDDNDDDDGHHHHHRVFAARKSESGSSVSWSKSRWAFVSHTERAQEISALYKELQPLETAVWYIEEYLKQRGNNHHEIPLDFFWPWWKKTSLDIFLVCGGMIVVSVTMPILLIVMCCVRIIGRKRRDNNIKRKSE